MRDLVIVYILSQFFVFHDTMKFNYEDMGGSITNVNSVIVS